MWMRNNSHNHFEKTLSDLQGYASVRAILVASLLFYTVVVEAQDSPPSDVTADQNEKTSEVTTANEAEEAPPSDTTADQNEKTSEVTATNKAEEAPPYETTNDQTERASDTERPEPETKTTQDISIMASVESDQADASQENNDDYSDLSLEELLEIKVTVASKTEETTATSPSTVTVLTRDDIRRLGVQSLEELLNYIPGYQVSPETTQGLHSRYAIRGRSTSLSEGVLLLIDGQRINDLIYGSPSVLKNRIAVENIERVEVIRGPGSALYGSNAFMGVINIVTDTNSSFLQGNAGENSSFGGSAKLSHDLGDLHVSGFARAYSSDGTRFREATDKWGKEGSVREPYSAGDVSIAALYKGLQLHLTHMSRDQQGYLMWDVLQDRAASESTRFSTAKLDYTLDVSDDLMILFSGSYSYTKWTSTGIFIPAGTELAPDFILAQPFRAGPYLREHQMEFSAEVHWQIYKDNLLVGGASYGNGKLLKIGNYLNHELPAFEPLGRVRLFINEETRWNSYDTRHIGGLYLQDKQTIAEFLYITAGVRADIYNDFGSTINPRAAVVWETPIDSHLKFMYGRAFQAPTYSQLYNRANPVDRGNADLKAEQINTVEVAYIQQILQRLEATAVYFYYAITDAIVPGTVPPPEDNPFNVLSWENGGKYHAQGVEFELRADLFAGISAFATYSYTFKPNFDLLVSAHSGSLALNYNYDRFNANISGVARSEPDVPELDDQGVYLVLNARAEYAIIDNLSLFLNMRNLTDQRYRTISQNVPTGLPNSGRFILTGVTISQ